MNLPFGTFARTKETCSEQPSLWKVLNPRSNASLAVSPVPHCRHKQGLSPPISYPESSDFLVSGWAPVETLGYWNFVTARFAVKQWKSLQGSQSKNLNFFEFPRVSTGAHPLTKKPEDSGHEIVSPPQRFDGVL